jgi:integrase
LQSEAKLNKIFVSCGFEVLSDINQQRFIRYVNDLSVSVKTQRDIISLMRTFSKWLYETSILPKDDFKMIKLPKVLESDRVHARRAFTADEIARLINVAENGEPFRGVSGGERALIYRLAVESGMRANEIKTLKVSSFDFKSSTVKILDSNEKARRGAIIELRKSTADLLKNFMRNKSPQAAAFAIKALKTGMMIRKDLAAAGITYEIDGKFADFHSLRHSTASLLIASGANVKAVQQIMRHATADLTLSKYSHLYAGQQRDAIEALPEFIYQAGQSIKTGTNDSENLVPDLCHFGANGGTQSHTETHNYQDTITAQNSDKVAFAAIKAGSEELLAKKRPRAFNLRPYNHP